TV
ncbi:mce related family protein, partial [Vibrio parahaemolyticus V-223/04]